MSLLDRNENPDVYYDGQYWNNLDCTNWMINRRISGDESVNWWKHFLSRTGKVFERALILNCGNGWVEREMIDGGLIKEAVGIDYSESLLDEARSAAEGRRLQYVQANVNSDALPPGPFDLVVNHAAAHHVTAVGPSLQEHLPTIARGGMVHLVRLRRTPQESICPRRLGASLQSQQCPPSWCPPIDVLSVDGPAHTG